MCRAEIDAAAVWYAQNKRGVSKKQRRLFFVIVFVAMMSVQMC
jgi:hypothetical protein